MRLIRELSNSHESDDDIELDYFFDIIEQFATIAQQETTPADQKILSLIARSPSSNIVLALDNCVSKFLECNIDIKIIFNQIAASDHLCDWLDPNNSPCGPNPETNIRWSGKTNLDEAHEQMALGQLISWTGESMRRESSTRYGFYILNENCQKTAQIAQHSFNSLWRVSKPIPQAQINRTSLATNHSYCIEQPAKGLNISVENAIYIPNDNTRH